MSSGWRLESSQAAGTCSCAFKESHLLSTRLIAPTFERLAKQADPDPNRPSIEFYRRRDVIDLLLPVA